jgi:nucleoside-diphosphate-sugar epimerase
MRLLLTGATGFLGRHLTAAASAHTVFRMVRARVSTNPNDIALGDAPWTAAEFTRAFALSEPDVVLHCAGETRSSNVRSSFEANAVLAGELLKAVAPTPHPLRVILVGSAAEYGFVPEDSQPVKETWPCNPDTTYGVAKHAQTLLALSARRRGLRVLVVRLFNAVGVGMPPHLALLSFARQIARGGAGPTTIHVGDLSSRRDFIDVREAARLILELAALSDWPWPLVNLCSGRAYRIGALLDALVAVSGVPIRIEARPERMRPNEMSVLVGDTMRIQSANLFPAAPDFASLLPRLLEDCRLTAGV